MNNDSLRILVAAMDLAPDALIDIDRDFKTNETDKMTDENRAYLVEQMANIRTVVNDESLAGGVALGYVISTAALVVATLSEVPVSQVHHGLMHKAMAAEEQAMLMRFLDSLFGGESESDVA